MNWGGAGTLPATDGRKNMVDSEKVETAIEKAIIDALNKDLNEKQLELLEKKVNLARRLKTEQ